MERVRGARADWDLRGLTPHREAQRYPSRDGGNIEKQGRFVVLEFYR